VHLTQLRHERDQAHAQLAEVRTAHARELQEQAVHLTQLRHERDQAHAQLAEVRTAHARELREQAVQLTQLRHERNDAFARMTKIRTLTMAEARQMVAKNSFTIPDLQYGLNVLCISAGDEPVVVPTKITPLKKALDAQLARMEWEAEAPPALVGMAEAAEAGADAGAGAPY